MNDQDKSQEALLEEVQQLRQTLAHLTQVESEHRSVVDHVVDGIVNIDAHGVIQAFNPAAEKIFGYAAAEVIGRNVKILMPEPYHSEHDGYVGDYLKTGHKKIIGIGREVMGKRWDGTTFPMDLGVSEFRLGQRRMFTGIIRDITERKGLEAQLVQAQKMESVGQLAGGIAHDFNNLLAGILGTLSLIRELDTSEEERNQRLERAEAIVQRGADLTKKMLAFSRKQMLAPKPTNVGDLVESMLDLMRRTLGETIMIGFEFSSGIWPAMVDPNQLENAILNMAINSRDAMSQGGALSIHTHNISVTDQFDSNSLNLTPGDYVSISVHDTGRGIPKD